MTTVADGLFQYGGMPVGMGIPPFLSRSGKTFFVDPVNGADGNDGMAPNRAFLTLYQLHNKMTSGNNDVGFLIGNGAISGAAVLSTALAQSIDSTATTGTLNWSKSACHLVGVASRSNNGRAKIATTYDRGDDAAYTAATFGGAVSFVNVTGAGCHFANISAQCRFSTGNASFICWTEAGQRNYYENCQFFGQMDSASAGGTASRSLVVGSGGQGENNFVRCAVGTDTVSRGVANASLELTGATPRNSFYGCIFAMLGSADAPLHILGTGAGCIDRWNLFDRCLFLNAIKSTGTTGSYFGSFTNAAPGGYVMLKDCDSVGFTKVGSTNFLANSYVSNVGGAATGALALNPS